MSEEEEEQKGKKSPAFFEARLPTIVGAGSRNWRGSPLLFLRPHRRQKCTSRASGETIRMSSSSPAKGEGTFEAQAPSERATTFRCLLQFKALSFQRLFLPPKKKKRT